MANEDKITMLTEDVENDKTGEKVQGITIIVDGKFQQVLDILKEQHGYENYTDLIRDTMFEGMNGLRKR